MGTEEPSTVEALCLGFVFNSLEVLGNGSQMWNGQNSLGELSCTPPKKQPTGSLRLGMVSSQSPCPNSHSSPPQADFGVLLSSRSSLCPCPFCFFHQHFNKHSNTDNTAGICQVEKERKNIPGEKVGPNQPLEVPTRFIFLASAFSRGSIYFHLPLVEKVVFPTGTQMKFSRLRSIFPPSEVALVTF